MEELGLNPKRFEFKATFGRELEYYTGFVFQIEVETPKVSSPWPVAAAMTISSPTWARPCPCPPWAAPFTPNA